MSTVLMIFDELWAFENFSKSNFETSTNKSNESKQDAWFTPGYFPFFKLRNEQSKGVNRTEKMYKKAKLHRDSWKILDFSFWKTQVLAGKSTFWGRLIH